MNTSDTSTYAERIPTERGVMMTQRSEVTHSELWMISVLALSAMLVCTGVFADTPTSFSDRQSGMSPDHMQKLMGTIKKTEKVGAKNTDQQLLLVQLKTQEQGKNITVDLGSVEQLKNMDVQVGNRIIVWGRLIIDGDNHLFRAHRLWIAGGTIDIER